MTDEILPELEIRQYVGKRSLLYSVTPNRKKSRFTSSLLTELLKRMISQ